MIEYDELISVIPHKGKMVLLSRILNFDLKERTIEAEYDITEECIFYDANISGVPAWAGFEFIAQTVSAITGIEDKLNNKPPRLGFILGLSQMKMDIPFFKIGNVVKIKTKEIENVYPIIYFFGELYLNDEKVFSGRLTVFDVDEEHKDKFGEMLKNG